jgi:hypothetical protein
MPGVPCCQKTGQPGGPVAAASVVNMQRAPIAQRKVGLGHHMPSLFLNREAGSGAAPQAEREHGQRTQHD